MTGRSKHTFDPEKGEVTDPMTPPPGESPEPMNWNRRRYLINRPKGNEPKGFRT